MFLIDFERYGNLIIYKCREIAHFKSIGVTEFSPFFLTPQTALRSRGTKRFLVQMVGKTQAGLLLSLEKSLTPKLIDAPSHGDQSYTWASMLGSPIPVKNHRNRAMHAINIWQLGIGSKLGDHAEIMRPSSLHCTAHEGNGRSSGIFMSINHSKST